jgi:hypothetical protein
MKRRLVNNAIILVFLLGLAGATLVAASSVGVDPAQDRPADSRLSLVSEETGMVASDIATSSACRYDSEYQVYLCPESAPSAPPERSPAAAARAARLLDSGGLLLVPDSTNDRVMAFDPLTGDLVDPDFIPADPDHLSTPINAILSAGGDSVLVSDQLGDVVQEYDMEGNYLGVFAPAGGPDPSILDNIRGIALRPNGNLLVTVGGGTNIDAVAEFDTGGNYLGNFVANGDGGLDSPFDAYGRSDDWLVGGSSSHAIHRYDLTGAYIADLTAIDSFPEQLTEASNSNVLVANFQGTEQGVVEYTSDGVLVGIYNPAALENYRGVYELPNGNILTTTDNGVFEIDRSGNLVETKIPSVGARFIELVLLDASDLALTKSGTPAEAAPGDTVTYTLTFSNTDVVTTTGAVIADEVPVYLTDLGFDNSGAVITPTGNVSYTWLVETLTPGDGGIITITGRLTMGLAAGFTFTNTATIASPMGDPNPDNNSGSVRVTVLNVPPVAQDDTASTPEDTAVIIDVLGNDTDPNGDALYVAFVGAPSNGSTSTDGVTVTYTPTANWNGIDVFTYTVSDAGNLTDNATVTVTVSPVNDPPTISEIPDQVIYENESTGLITFTIGDVEVPPAELALSGESSNAALVPNSHIIFGGLEATRTVIITPTADLVGTSTITVTVDDGTDTADEIFALTVLEPNAPPVAQDDTASTPEDTAVIIDVLGNDTDPNGDALYVAFVGDPSNGSTSTDGVTVTYTPTADWNGIDVFTYTVSDTGNLTDNATVTVTVSPVNDPPTISEIPDQILYENESTGPITFTIGDLETPPAELTLSGESSNAALVPNSHIVFGGLEATRTVLITPTADLVGTSTITITVNDGTDTADESFTLTVLEWPVLRLYLPLVLKAIE